jgi:hypothetical protein
MEADYRPGPVAGRAVPDEIAPRPERELEIGDRNLLRDVLLPEAGQRRELLVAAERPRGQRTLGAAEDDDRRMLPEHVGAIAMLVAHPALRVRLGARQVTIGEPQHVEHRRRDQYGMLPAAFVATSDPAGSAVPSHSPTGRP